MKRMPSSSPRNHFNFQDWGTEETATADCFVSEEDVRNLGDPCKVILRCRQAKTPWECVVRAMVGEPVHVDVVLSSPGSASGRFCFSSYMSQKFEMSMMSPEMVHDDSVTNIALDITQEEHERCTKFLTALDGKASYSYFDAMVLMPMAPKVVFLHSFLFVGQTLRLVIFLVCSFFVGQKPLCLLIFWVCNLNSLSTPLAAAAPLLLPKGFCQPYSMYLRRMRTVQTLKRSRRSSARSRWCSCSGEGFFSVFPSYVCS